MLIKFIKKIKKDINKKRYKDSRKLLMKIEELEDFINTGEKLVEEDFF